MYDESPARIEVIAVTREMVDRYNARHPQARLAWPPMPAGQPDYLSIAEVAKMSGRHRQTISQMIARGDLESRVCGARVVVLASSVREWMEGGVEEELTPDTAGR
jgi:excisionase family DNA binding protein